MREHHPFNRKRPFDGRPLEKVSIPLDQESWTNARFEVLWAERLKPDKLRLRNVPFAAYGYSFGDVVVAKKEKNANIVEGPALGGGHSTYRIFLSAGASMESGAAHQHWQNLARENCTLERATKSLYAIDVPPEANIFKVYEMLEAGEKKGLWEFEEGHCGHSTVK